MPCRALDMLRSDLRVTSRRIRPRKCWQIMMHDLPGVSRAKSRGAAASIPRLSIERIMIGFDVNGDVMIGGATHGEQRDARLSDGR